MKVIKSDETHYEIFLNQFDLPQKEVKKEELESYLKTIFLRLKKEYDLQVEGYYHIDIYEDPYYGMVLDMEKEELGYYDFSFHQIEMHITLEKDAKFLYQLEDFFMIPNDLRKKGNCYFEKGKYYFLPTCELTLVEQAVLMEQSRMIYQDTDLIIDRAKLVLI